jgi:hypothetical protein
LVAVDATRAAAQQRPSERPNPTYDDITREIAMWGRQTPRSYLINFGRTAPDEVISRAANALAAETDADRLLACLRIFRRRRFPLDPARLVALADAADEEVAVAALAALAQIRHPAVRTLALSLIAEGRHPADAVGLLEHNFETGDYARIAAVMAATISDPEAYYSVGFDVLAVVKAHPAPEAAGVLLHVYEHGPCSFCREGAVDLLHALGALPEWVIEECQHDSNTRLRAKAHEYGAPSAESLPSLT